MPSISIVFSIALMGCCSLVGAPQENWRPLFLQADLSGYETWLGKPHSSIDLPQLSRSAAGDYIDPVGPNHDPLKVFSYADSAEGPLLRVSGEIFGFMVTKERFANYHLRLQFKWGDQKWPPRKALPRDSGLLYHVGSTIAEPGRSFPRSVELQIQENDLGDLYAVAMRVTTRAKLGSNGKPYHDPAGEILELGPTLVPKGNRCHKQADFERPRGEWNSLELICFQGSSWHIVNGQVVMSARDPKQRSGDAWEPFHDGRIALQSEGAEIFFRRIEIKPIGAVPAGLVSP